MKMNLSFWLTDLIINVRVTFENQHYTRIISKFKRFRYIVPLWFLSTFCIKLVRNSLSYEFFHKKHLNILIASIFKILKFYLGYEVFHLKWNQLVGRLVLLIKPISMNLWKLFNFSTYYLDPLLINKFRVEIELLVQIHNCKRGLWIGSNELVENFECR